MSKTLVKYKITNPNDMAIDCSLTVTMLLQDWKTLRKLAGKHTLFKLTDAIDEMINGVENIYEGEIEEAGD